MTWSKDRKIHKPRLKIKVTSFDLAALTTSSTTEKLSAKSNGSDIDFMCFEVKTKCDTISDMSDDSSN